VNTTLSVAAAGSSVTIAIDLNTVESSFSAPDGSRANRKLSAQILSFLFADITGQSLPTLEDSDFAWFDNACTLCHFPLPCTSPKQLDVNCDVVFFCAVLRG
jgi:hypothetical protein